MKNETHRNEKLTGDAISGTSDDRPLGTAMGAVGGALTGAAVGSPGGPMGSLVGAMIGTAAGAIAGKGIAKGLDPEKEVDHWRQHHHLEPYYKPEHPFEDYEPAYRLGWESYDADKDFEAMESSLRQEWEKRDHPPLSWDNARLAASASWQRIHHTRPKAD